MPQDYYEILELSRTCTLEDISEAYRRLSLKYHPKAAKKEETAVYSYKFHRLAEAYEVLSDPNKKGIYDIYGFEGLSNGILTPAGELKGCYKYCGNADEIFNKFMGTSNPFALMRDCEKIDDDWGSAFNSAYGGLKEKLGAKKESIKVTLECTLKELYIGTVKHLKYKRHVLNYDMRTTEEREQDLEIEIFPGYYQDKILTFPKMGNEYPGEETTDLEVKIIEKKDEKFKRVNVNDLIYIQRLTLSQALNSEPVKFETLDGRILCITMDEIITPQSVKIIEGEGMPIYSKEIDVKDLSVKKGNLFIKFHIIFPEYIDPVKKEQIIKLLENDEE